MSAPSVVERGTRFALEPLGEFSLQAAARFWGGFTPASHAGVDAEGHLHMAFPVEGSWTSVGVCVREVEGTLVGHMYGDDDTEVVRRQTARILSLDVDGRGFSQLGKRDSVAADLQRRFRGLRPVCFYSSYEAATWAIISQRLRMQQAAAIKARLSEAYGEWVLRGAGHPDFLTFEEPRFRAAATR